MIFYIFMILYVSALVAKSSTPHCASISRCQGRLGDARGRRRPPGCSRMPGTPPESNSKNLKFLFFIFFVIFVSGGLPAGSGRRLPTGCCCPPLGGLRSTRGAIPTASAVAPLEILAADIPGTSGMDVGAPGGAQTAQIGARHEMTIFGPFL